MIGASSTDNWIALALAVGAVLYVFLVLVFPEKF
ncbi:MAG TPA: potassium-transporting ATPase subunit F [Ilumatobacteraceae bacterium]|nr:potassium-transporting ATPase subunit F [Ilumatobacteraceae bacterium]